MSQTIRITVPGFQDLEYMKKIGHIVFRMDQLGNDEDIKKVLTDHLTKTKRTEQQIETTTIEHLNEKSEI